MEAQSIHVDKCSIMKMELIEKIVAINDWKDLSSLYVHIMRQEGRLYQTIREKVLELKKTA